MLQVLVLCIQHYHEMSFNKYDNLTQIDKTEPILPVNIKDGKITMYRRGWKVFLNTGKFQLFYIMKNIFIE